MKLRYRLANQVVGVFVILALALTATLLVMMGINQRWFKKNFVYHTEFTTAEASVGMPITFRGFTIGQVTDVTLNEENTVDVIFYIQEEYIDKVNRDSLIQLVSNPLGGGQLVLHQGTEPTAPPAEGATIPRYESKDGLRLRRANRVTVLRNDDPISTLLAQVDRVGPIIDNIDATLASVSGIAAQLENTLSGQGSGPIPSMLSSADEAVAQLQTAVARVNLLVADTSARMDGVMASLEDISANVEQTTAAIADPTGLIPRLLDPTGSIATFLNDDNQLYNQVQSVIGDLSRSIVNLQGSIAEIEGFTQYLNQTQPQISGLLEEGRQALDTGQEVLEGLRNNPLLRRGIPEAVDQPSTFQGIRDEEF